MIGGGFSASDTFEYDAMIAGSYPSSASRWTVVAASSPAFILEVMVYCLSASPAYGVQIVQAAISPGGRVTCPAGTILLGGGFQGTEAVVASRPDGNGWYSATSNGAAGQVYAQCASQHVMAGSIATVTYNPHSSSHGYVPGSAQVTCPPNQRATGGGFSGGDLLLASESDGVLPANWTFTAGGDGDESFSTVCVMLTA
jgi:hypothetical protein